MLGAMPNPNQPAIPSDAPDVEDVYDWYYQDTYGITSAEPGPYPRQDVPHDGLTIAMTGNPVSGDWVYPAVGGFLLVQNIHSSLVAVSLPLDDVDDVEPAGSRTLTVEAADWALTGDMLEDEAGAALLDEAGDQIGDQAAGGNWAGGWAILPVPPQVYGYEPVPIVFDGIPNVAYLNCR
jgi:hypothetical protein